MRRTHKDHSGEPRSRLPPLPKRDLILFHWSPTTNRKRILREGLTIRNESLQGGARFPVICFADDPSLAWILSGKMFPQIEEWDLWMCNVDEQTSFQDYEVITDTYPDTGRRFIKEYRVYTRVFKRDLEYLATRRQEV